ncbi:MAG: CAP domain-containing protein [Hyphomonas sp.]|uniref:CAP domain-containing protein n=2 Tax=Hyphomonas sp. TaxID=87 RepID=UPI00326515A2
MSISALALAALGLTANAQQACDLSDGLGLQPAAFQTETEACFEGLNGVTPDTFMQTELRRFTEAARTSAGKDRLENLPTLKKAAMIHAYDMAVRGYVAHDDLEGRSHLDRVRLLDRSHLMGAFGANMAIVDDSATAAEAYDALMADSANRANLTREEFDHTGVAAVRANGRIYLVQLFSRVEGKLQAPVPTQMNGKTDLKAVFAESRAEPLGWSVVSTSGNVLAQGIGNSVPASELKGQSGYLTIDMALGRDRYTLKGPAVSLF